MAYSNNTQSKKTKILYLITQSELGGAQRYVFDLATNLRDDFDIAVAAGEPGERGELVQKLKQTGFVCENQINQKNQQSAVGSRQSIHVIPRLKRAVSPANDLLALIGIIKIIKKIKPDIIHLNSSKISVLGSIAAFIANLPAVNRKLLVVYTVHGWVLNEPMPAAKKLFYEYAEKFTARLKNKIICVSKSDYDTARTQLKIPEKKLALIHNGIKPINFLSRKEARRKLSRAARCPLPACNLVIGAIGNLYKTKGFEYLIEAIKILAAYNPRLTAIIIGEGAERKSLENIIWKNRLTNAFFLAGKIGNAAELLPAFDIYVCSSVKEGLPYSILEAMAAGLPIVSTDVGGVPEMIADGENGLLVKPKKPRHLAGAMGKVIKDGRLREQIKSAARKKMKEKFDIKNMLQKTKAVYRGESAAKTGRSF